MAASGILASMSVVLSGEISGFRRAMAEAKKELIGFSKAGDALKGAGESLLPLSAGLALAGAGALKAGSDFQAGMNRVQAATQATGPALDALKDKAKAIALDPRLKFTAQDSAAAIENLAKNGLSAAQILNGAADATVNLATATGGQLTTSADIATDVMNNFNLATKDLAAGVDNITGTTIASKLNIDEYRQALGQAGGVAGQLGVKFEDFNTALAVTSSGFSSGSDAGTSFKTFLQRLVPQSKEAATAMEKLGLKFFDAQGQMRPLREIAGELQRAFKGLSDEQRNQLGTEIFGADSIRTALLLAKQGTEGFDEMAKSIGKVNAASQGAILSQGFAGALEGFKSALEGLGIAIAESGLLDFGTKVLKSASALVSGLAQANPTLLKLAVVVGAVVASIGPLLIAIGAIGVAVPAVVGGLAVLGTAFTAVGAAAGTAWAFILGPIAPILAGIALVVAAGVLLYKNWETIKETANKLTERLQSVLRLVGTGALTLGFTALGTAALGAASGMDNLTIAIGHTKAEMDSLRATFKEVNKNVFDPKFNQLPAAWLTAANAAKVYADTAVSTSAPGKISALTAEQLEALAALQKALRDNENLSRALGDSYDFIGGKSKALESGIESLVKVGFAPAGRTVQGFVNQLNGIPEALDRIQGRLSQGIGAPKVETPEFAFATNLQLPTVDPFDTKNLDASVRYFEGTALQIQDTIAGLELPPLPPLPAFDTTPLQESFTGLESILVDAGAAVQQGLASVIASSAAAFGEVLATTGSVGDALQATFGAILQGMAAFAVQFGQLLIAQGTAVLLAKSVAANPVAAIAAGAALVAIGSAAGALLKKGPKLTGGGGGGSTPSVSATPTASRTPTATAIREETAIQNNTQYIQLTLPGGFVANQLAIDTNRRGRVTGVRSVGGV